MNETYCGKICENCAWREEHSCPGCKLGPGGRGGNCEIAACCLEKGHTDCTTCGFQLNCQPLRARDELPQQRQYAQEAREARGQWHREMAPLLGKWLWISFWLIVPSTVIGLTDERLLGSPTLATIGKVASIVLMCVGALCLIKLEPADPRYRTAGWCALISGLVVEVTNLLKVDGAGIALLWLIPAMCVAMYASYLECHAHAAVLEGLDDELAEKWRMLWKWEVGLILVMLGSIVVMLLIPMLGALLILAAAIGLVVVSIVNLVYQYRTAQRFRHIFMNERMALPDETAV